MKFEKLYTEAEKHKFSTYDDAYDAAMKYYKSIPLFDRVFGHFRRYHCVDYKYISISSPGMRDQRFYYDD